MEKLFTIFSLSLIATVAQAHENIAADSFAHLFAHTGEALGVLALAAVTVVFVMQLRKRKHHPVANKNTARNSQK